MLEFTHAKLVLDDVLIQPPHRLAIDECQVRPRPSHQMARSYLRSPFS